MTTSSRPTWTPKFCTGQWGMGWLIKTTEDMTMVRPNFGFVLPTRSTPPTQVDYSNIARVQHLTHPMDTCSKCHSTWFAGDGAAILLQHARELYDFANTHRCEYSDSIMDDNFHSSAIISYAMSDCTVLPNQGAATTLRLAQRFHATSVPQLNKVRQGTLEGGVVITPNLGVSPVGTQVLEGVVLVRAPYHTPVKYMHVWLRTTVRVPVACGGCVRARAVTSYEINIGYTRKDSKFKKLTKSPPLCCAD
uniref:Uncharacterized protein n=1 Tax=Timema poppense TaxID=170557 RepID=A0A7R9GWB9_TIMPO|nr:unnamed protein product [Timema poppensis]